MSKVQEKYKYFCSFLLLLFFFFLFNGSCLLSIFTNKSSDLVVYTAHEKIGSLIKHSNNDLFIALKVNYSIGP
jgi:hypothetical protein